MRQVYFSHSYRDEDRAVNAYFLDLFASHPVKLVADMKSECWCVPKLEKYLMESDGFIAIVPRRHGPDGRLVFSEYIGVELTLARRRGLPSLVFVDDALLAEVPDAFPPDVVPFVREAPRSEEPAHRDRIKEFCASLDTATARPATRVKPRDAAVFLGERTPTALIDRITRSLCSQGYHPRLVLSEETTHGLNNLSALDLIRASEFAVCCFEGQLGRVDIALAIAHALSRPTFRLYRDPACDRCKPDLYGVLRWQVLDQLFPVFEQQLASYRLGFVDVVALPEDDKEDILKAIATGKEDILKAVAKGDEKIIEQLLPPEWDPQEPLSLVNYVQAGDPLLRQELNAIRELFGKGFPDLVAAEKHDELCAAIYTCVQRRHWVYEFEPPSKDYSRQRVRMPRHMYTDLAGTCLDFACFFAALLEGMQAQPVLVRLRWPAAAHALAGCWIRNQPAEALVVDKQRIVKALTAGDLLLLETTGAARADDPVAGESGRVAGFLGYEQAKEQAHRLLAREDVQVHFLLNVLAAR